MQGHPLQASLLPGVEIGGPASSGVSVCGHTSCAACRKARVIGKPRAPDWDVVVPDC